MSKIQTHLETLSDPFRLELLRSVRSGELETLLNPAPIQNYTLHSNQIPPEGDWFIHFHMAGRGAGKSFALAHWIIQKAFENPGARIALVSPTRQEARFTVNQILELHDKTQTPKYSNARSTITWANGSVVEVLSTEDRDNLRGKQFHYGAGTEFTRWKTDGCYYGPNAFRELKVAVRLGSNPQIYLEGAPKPAPHIRALLEQSMQPGSDIVTTRSSSFSNQKLSRRYLESLTRSSVNSSTANQEIFGDYEDEFGRL